MVNQEFPPNPVWVTEHHNWALIPGIECYELVSTGKASIQVCQYGGVKTILKAHGRKWFTDYDELLEWYRKVCERGIQLANGKARAFTEAMDAPLIRCVPNEPPSGRIVLD